MALSVLFTHSFFLRLDRKQLRTAKPYPPLATLYAAAAAREAGHEVQFFDATWARSADELQAPLEQHRPDVLVIYDDSFNWITKMCLAVMQRQALAMIDRARRMGIRVLVSGSDATDHQQQYLEAGAEAVFLGDGEPTLVESLERIEAGESVDGVIGTSRLKDGSLVSYGRRPTPHDLDTLPRPAWDLVDLQPYRQTWTRKHGYFSLNLVSSRGCPYRCSWCAKPIFGRGYQTHSPARVALDLADAGRRGAEHVWFGDDIFGLTPEWAVGLADEVEASGSKVPFMIQTRADLMVQDDLRRGLVRAGLAMAWMGAESGSQKILDAMQKDLEVEQTREAVHKLRADGVKVGLFIQYGYLGEDQDDIRQTLALLKELLPDDLGISVSYPLPGTPFHEEVRTKMSEKTNWEHSDDLDPLYPGAKRADYYHRLHRYTHRMYRTHRGLHALGNLVRSPSQATWLQLREGMATLLHGPAFLSYSLLMR